MRLIAIVDDRATNRAIFSRLAMSLGTNIRVTTFSTSMEALESFEAGEIPDLVITDYRMPLMDGADFTARIRGFDWGWDVPVLIVTAYEDRAYRISALDSGATDFLLSPVDHTEFLTRVRNLLQLRWHQLRVRRHAARLEKELQTSREAHVEALRESRDQLIQVIDSIPAFVSASDDKGNCIFSNKFQTNVMGPAVSSTEESRKADQVILQNGLAVPRYEEKVRDRYGLERYLLTSKVPLHDVTTGRPYILTTSLDITDRKKAEQELQNLAWTDQLTGLVSRSRLETMLRSSLQNSSPELSHAFLLIDLDRFKGVNDTLGHTSGDVLLRKVAQRLRLALPGPGLICRLGGDEFAIIRPVENREAAADLAEQLIRIFDHPFSLSERKVVVGASIGVRLFRREEWDSFETLLRQADLAMYRAKHEGGSRYVFFSHAIEEEFRQTTELEQALREAVEERRFVLHYQPEVDLTTGRLTGAEALLRQVRPDGSLSMPGEFLGIAEETGLIIPMTLWCLQEACRQGAEWARAGLKLRIAVNISGILFRHHNLHELVTRATLRHGFDPSMLELELTETTLIESNRHAAQQLTALQQMGVSIAIDDFGTGYASLIYLTRLPIRLLKIDKIFMNDVTTSAENQAVVKAIISLGQTLGKRVIAEGIETESQLAWLRDHGCELGQGYYFSPPLPAEDFTARFSGNAAEAAGGAVFPVDSVT
ncbi:EAL domain-containing protein [Acetobacter sp. AN02]|uniref:EAL domain-containing response regulator n=1 Tax=Acetobacter sp. AN02 TaxID=2894186 RepID=UPI0024341FB7|nr:EAL domain-containing protein [Acetobacter sp. AN02]MDG6095018.1 EAL domain-containing protein [Acetobacter sp. AN02]